LLLTKLKFLASVIYQVTSHTSIILDRITRTKKLFSVARQSRS